MLCGVRFLFCVCENYLIYIFSYLKHLLYFPFVSVYLNNPQSVCFRYFAFAWCLVTNKLLYTLSANRAFLPLWKSEIHPAFWWVSKGLHIFQILPKPSNCKYVFSKAQAQTVNYVSEQDDFNLGIHGLDAILIEARGWNFY